MSRLLLASSLLLLLGVAPVAVAQERPNVVIVITDDQGYGDLSCHGNPILKTPEIDKLYAESVRLTDYHVAPTCSPTRSSFLTGHWTDRTGVWHTIMGRSMLREDEVTLGKYFKDAGYRTGMFGKWHLGDNVPFRPEDRGFTDVLRHGGGGVGQTPDYWDNAYFDGHYFRYSQEAGKTVPERANGFCTDVFFDAAEDFIRTQHKNKQPFLAYIATNAPHGPMHSPPEASKPYASVNNVGLQNFYGMIANIDENVGELRGVLEELGLTENTIFIFTTDNGTSSGAKVFNAGMRGQKGSEYDGGHRVPFFCYWPKGRVTGGRDVDWITHASDVVPTLLNMCGIQPPKSAKFDGRSIYALLNLAANAWPERVLVTDSQRVKDPIKWRKTAVMTDRWRLVNGKELYDIEADPGQKNNIAKEHPEVVARLTAWYDKWWAELEPTFANATAIRLGSAAENPARLTSHDWITTGSTPWNQSHVRGAMKGERNTGFWNVDVESAGEYEFRLRRWPRESGATVRSSLPPGDDVPGVRPYRMTPGKAINVRKASIRIGGTSAAQEVSADTEEVVFVLNVPAGKTHLSARFFSEDGTEYGAYYVYVKKMK